MRLYICNQDFGSPDAIVRIVRRQFPEAGFIWVDTCEPRIFEMRVLRVDEFDFDILDEIMERFLRK